MDAACEDDLAIGRDLDDHAFRVDPFVGVVSFEVLLGNGVAVRARLGTSRATFSTTMRVVGWRLELTERDRSGMAGLGEAKASVARRVPPSTPTTRSLRSWLPAALR